MSDDIRDDGLFSYSTLDPQKRIKVWGPEGLLPLGLDDPRVLIEGIYNCGDRDCRMHKGAGCGLGSMFSDKAPSQSGKSDKAWHCKECASKYKSELRQRDPEKTKRQDTEKYQKNREKILAEGKERYHGSPTRRQRNRELKYNLPPGGYDVMADAQDWVCAICWQPETAIDLRMDGNTKDLAVDHDHQCCPKHGSSCGKCVRGLLCQDCNMGNFCGDPVLMLKATVYILWWRIQHEKATDQDRSLFASLLPLIR
jgi:hypothetical protein